MLTKLFLIHPRNHNVKQRNVTEYRIAMLSRLCLIVNGILRQSDDSNMSMLFMYGSPHPKCIKASLLKSVNE